MCVSRGTIEHFLCRLFPETPAFWRSPLPHPHGLPYVLPPGSIQSGHRAHVQIISIAKPLERGSSAWALNILLLSETFSFTNGESAPKKDPK